MERKNIDEIDESFFGEEIVENENSKIKGVVKAKEIKAKTTKRTTKVSKKKEIKLDADVEAIKAEILKTVKEDTITVIPETVNEKPKKIELNMIGEKPKVAATKPEVKISPAISSSKPIDPWDEELALDEEGMFSKASTWKAITGVLVLLLLFSAFSSGTGTETITGENIGLKLAEEKALDYVNTELLQAPFTAELKGSEELDDLYRLKFSVAGQEVDSYLTKDGEIFFPQGFDLNGEGIVLAEETTLDAPIEEVVVEETVEETLAEEEINPEVMEEPSEEEVEEATIEEVVEEEVVEEVTVQNSVQFNLHAKKWLFNPRTITVSQGDSVQLNIVPDGLAFTFAIADLGVEQDINGATTVSFTAGSIGSYDMTCSSCESWRGMSGTLIVE